jgi:2-aminoadipate transaminase
MDSVAIFEDAVKEKVAFVPGQSFHADGSGKNTFRMNFSNSSPEMIVEGVRRLSIVIKKHLNK